MYTNNLTNIWLPVEAVTMLEATLFLSFTLPELNLGMTTSRRLPVVPTLVNFLSDEESESENTRESLCDDINIKLQQVVGRKCFTGEKNNLYMLQAKDDMGM